MNVITKWFHELKGKLNKLSISAKYVEYYKTHKEKNASFWG